MSDNPLHHAAYSFLIAVVDRDAVAENYQAVQDHFQAFVQAYDPGQAKALQWRHVPYLDVVEWVSANSSNPTEYRAKWALAASVSFFRYDGGSSAQGIPDPCPGCWGSTALQATTLNTLGASSYEWVYHQPTQTWVRVCETNFALSASSGSPLVSPQIMVNSEVVANIRARLVYGQETVTTP